MRPLGCPCHCTRASSTAGPTLLVSKPASGCCRAGSKLVHWKEQPASERASGCHPTTGLTPLQTPSSLNALELRAARAQEKTDELRAQEKTDETQTLSTPPSASGPHRILQQLLSSAIQPPSCSPSLPTVAPTSESLIMSVLASSVARR